MHGVLQGFGQDSIPHSEKTSYARKIGKYLPGTFDFNAVSRLKKTKKQNRIKNCRLLHFQASYSILLQCDRWKKIKKRTYGDNYANIFLTSCNELVRVHTKFFICFEDISWKKILKGLKDIFWILKPFFWKTSRFIHEILLNYIKD